MIAAAVLGCGAAPGEEEVARASAAPVSERRGEEAPVGPAARAEEDGDRAAMVGARAGEVDADTQRADATPGATSPGTGRDEYDSLPIGCERAIASRQEDERTIVYITPTEKGRAGPGQWVHCAWPDRPPSSTCEVLAIVDGGMLEARCGEVKPGSSRPPK